MKEPIESENAPAACRALKTKMHYVAGYEHERFLPSNTAHYWCIRTMNTIGPDDHLVVPEHCCSGRSCFESE